MIHLGLKCSVIRHLLSFWIGSLDDRWMLLKFKILEFQVTQDLPLGRVPNRNGTQDFQETLSGLPCSHFFNIGHYWATLAYYHTTFWCAHDRGQLADRVSIEQVLIFRNHDRIWWDRLLVKFSIRHLLSFSCFLARVNFTELDLHFFELGLDQLLQVGLTLLAILFVSLITQLFVALHDWNHANFARDSNSRLVILDLLNQILAPDRRIAHLGFNEVVWSFLRVKFWDLPLQKELRVTQVLFDFLLSFMFCLGLNLLLPI